MTDALREADGGPRPADEYRRQGWWTGIGLVERYRGTVRRRATATAVVDDRGVELTHAELWSAAGRFADELGTHGVRPRDIVAIILPNVAEWHVALLGCLRFGAVPATMPVTTDEETIRHSLGLVAATAVVAMDRHRGRNTGDLVRAAAAGLDSPIAVGLLGDDGWHWTDDADAAGRPAPRGVDQVMFTSSTTGLPKAVAHTEDTLGAVNAGFEQRFGLGPDRPIFMPSPLGHSVGAWHGSRLAMYTGAPLVLLDRWDPERALDLLEQRRCAFTAAATPFLTDLVDVASSGLGTLRTFLCGGAPVPPSLMTAAVECSPATSFSALWGMTEGGVTTCRPDCPPDERAGTVGVPLPGLELRIDDGPGELTMRGPGVCVGYLNQESLFRELLTEDGFFRTGDLATLDDDGHLRITGRIKDLIIRGGVNVSPTITEDAIAAHPDVTSVAAFGVPDPRLGERIGAAVTNQGTTIGLADLCGWLEERGVPRRHWPEHLFTVREMPRTAAGKIRKNVLRDHVLGEGE